MISVCWPGEVGLGDVVEGGALGRPKEPRDMGEGFAELEVCWRGVAFGGC